jgi:transcriptional regulator with XRE-family HTH domain
MQLQSSNHVRRRGVTLTRQGSRKLNRAKAGVEIEQNFKRYTLEALSEKTGLTSNTLSKVFTSSAGVDKRTLECLFDAFNLTLSTEDYLFASTNPLQIDKMARSHDELQPRPPTAPGGQMPLDSVFYIDRPILESLYYEAIQQPGALLNIRAPKQMGKTSLMTRILAYAKTQGDRTVSVSLQLADAEILQNLERFLKWFCARVSKQLDLPKSRRSA